MALSSAAGITAQAVARRRTALFTDLHTPTGMAAVCPISARSATYPGEVPIGRGQAGQTKDAFILCHQLRTIDSSRATTFEVGGRPQVVTDPEIRREVRAALARHLGLDLLATEDGAA